MKKLIKSVFIAMIAFMVSACGIFQRDAFEDIDIYVTSYIIEFITQELYGEFSNIRSVFPDGVDIHEHSLTPRQITEFSNGRLFIFNGLGNERNIAVSLINTGSGIHIMDVSRGLDVRNDEARLWISPFHTLMVAENIRLGLQTLITNTFLLEEIDRNYEQLRALLMGYSIQFNEIADLAANHNVIAANSAFDFLTRYGFNVISIDNDSPSSAALNEAEAAFNAGENNYLFILKGTEITEDIELLLEIEGVELAYVNPMFNLTDDERRNGYNYVTFMEEFLEALRNEVF